MQYTNAVSNISQTALKIFYLIFQTVLIAQKLSTGGRQEGKLNTATITASHVCCNSLPYTDQAFQHSATISRDVSAFVKQC